MLTNQDVRALGAMIDDLRRDVVDQFRLSQRDHAQIMTAISKTQEAHCPSVFTIILAGRKKLTGTRYILRLYCEQPGTWHPLPGNTGSYEFAAPAGWLKRFGPYIATTLKILKTAVPYIGPILGIAAPDLQEQIKNEVDLAELILGDIPSGPTGTRIPPVGGLDQPRGQARNDADFRVLREMLEQLDPTRRWGGLSHIVTPEGLRIYVCSDHEATYRRLPSSGIAR
jgi:internalin A